MPSEIDKILDCLVDIGKYIYIALYMVDEGKHIVTISRIFYGKQDYEKHI